jgi:hypothetical protein
MSGVKTLMDATVEKILELLQAIRETPEQRQRSIEELKALVHEAGDFILTYNDGGQKRYLTLNQHTLERLTSHFLNKGNGVFSQTAEYMDAFFVNEVQDLRVAYKFRKGKAVVPKTTQQKEERIETQSQLEGERRKALVNNMRRVSSSEEERKPKRGVQSELTGGRVTKKQQYSSDEDAPREVVVNKRKKQESSSEEVPVAPSTRVTRKEAQMVSKMVQEAGDNKRIPENPGTRVTRKEAQMVSRMIQEAGDTKRPTKKHQSSSKEVPATRRTKVAKKYESSSESSEDVPRTTRGTQTARKVHKGPRAAPHNAGRR